MFIDEGLKTTSEKVVLRGGGRSKPKYGVSYYQVVANEIGRRILVAVVVSASHWVFFEEYIQK